MSCLRCRAGRPVACSSPTTSATFSASTGTRRSTTSSHGLADWRGEHMLIVMSGLPGVGTTTIARELERSLSAVHVRSESVAAHPRRMAGCCRTDRRARAGGRGGLHRRNVASPPRRIARRRHRRSPSANVAGGPRSRLPPMGQSAACDRHRRTDCARERAGDHCATATAGVVRSSVIGRLRLKADTSLAFGTTFASRP